MTEHSDFTKFSQRLADLANRFEEKAKSKSQEPGGRGPRNLLTNVYTSLRDLFTRDVTREGLREMLHHDARDTFRFFTREVDFEAIRPLPWHKRYPKTAWEIFKALAYRLNPPRRIAFALAMFAFLLGSIEFLSFSVQVENGSWVVQSHTGSGWWLIAIVILVFLLLLELRDKLDLKADLNIAREIQFGLVPSAPFQENQIQIHCQMRPANTVGGDYYDIIELEAKKRVAIVVGDVAGKGMPAALLMALLQSSLRTLITAGFRGSTLVSKLNDYLCVSIPQNSLVTLFYGELDTIECRLSYVNAGHNGPFLLRQTRELERLDSTSMVLGIIKDPAFEPKEAQLYPGDRLILFTDGISEAFNEKNEEYGEERLGVFIQQNRESNPPLFIQTLFSEVLQFCGSVKPTDDMTLMVIKRQD
jgi:sigma-B regulation protein RsbU (phosphoserine phosphatase)